MSIKKRIQLIVHLEHGCHRRLLEGAAAYANVHTEWDLVLTHYERDRKQSALDPKAQGMIFPHRMLTGKRSAVRRLGVPMVMYGMHVRGPKAKEIIQLFPDERLIGQHAAEHLIERGFQSFAYVHSAYWSCSLDRGSSFRKHLAHRGHTCRWIDTGALIQSGDPQSIDALARVLSRLPKPVGIFAINDLMATYVARAAHLADLSLPGEIALLGTDNDALLCETTTPSLSSIDSDWHRLGWQAAKFLDLLSQEVTISSLIHPIPPKGVALRTSTDFLAFSDPVVVRALCFIREHIAAGITTRDVLAHVLLSRPTLEKRFKQLVGHTVAEEILRTRIERAQRLLLKTARKIDDIALACGFAGADSLYRNFRTTAGCTPAQFRKGKSSHTYSAVGVNG